MKAYRALALPIALFASGANASNAGLGAIDSPLGMVSGALLFNTNGARTAAPSCQGAGVPNRFALDTSTVAGQSQAKLLLNAYNRRQRITVVGTGTCSIQADTETVNYFLVEDATVLGATYNRTGHIVKTAASGGGNFGFRIYLDNNLAECTLGFAYKNKSFDNYDVYVSNLMSAYYTGKSINLTYGVDPGGYCEIIEYTVQ